MRSTLARAAMTAFLAALGFSCAAVSSEPAAPSALERVVAIGASMTAGTRLESDAGDVLEAMIQTEHEPVQTNAELLFFANPERFGTQQAKFAREADPTLLVALDFLFWFGYGVTEDRLALLETGLAHLAEFDCPIVVGDFPNMEDAVGKMISRAQMPTRNELVALNLRLSQWVALNPHVTLIPLAKTVARMRAGEPFQLGRFTWPAGSRDKVLQSDQLHPTLEGLAGTFHMIGVDLVTGGVVSEDELQLDFDVVMAGLAR